MSGGGGKGGSMERQLTEEEMKALVLPPGWEARVAAERADMEQKRTERKTAREQADDERESAVRRTRK